MAKKKVTVRKTLSNITKADDKYLTTAIVSGIAGLAAAVFLSKQYFSSEPEHELNECSSSSHYLTIGALCALVGAGAALLLAPKAGKALRKDICDTCDDVQDYTNDLKEDLTDRANKWTSKARKAVNRIYDDAEDIQEEYTETIKDKITQFIDLAEVGLRIFNSLKGK